MENAEDKLLGMNRTHLAILMAIFMINSCILTLVFGPYLITDSAYFTHHANESRSLVYAPLLALEIMVETFFFGWAFPTVILLSLNKLISVIKHAIRGKAY